MITELPADLPTLTLDRPGYQANPEAPSDITGNAEWLLSELDGRGIDQAILVGHSYGGGIALATAALAPERVTGLALVASIGPDCVDGWDALLASPFFGPVLAIFAWWLMPWVARRRVARLERKQGRPLRPDEHIMWSVWGNARHDHGAMWRTFLHEQRALMKHAGDLEKYVEKVVAPTVVIADPDDRVVPVSTAEALTTQLAQSRLVLTSGCGHELPWRKPDLIAQEITNLAHATT